MAWGPGSWPGPWPGALAPGPGPFVRATNSAKFRPWALPRCYAAIKNPVGSAWLNDVGLTQHGSWLGWARLGSDRPGRARLGSAWLGCAQVASRGLAVLGWAQLGSA